MWPFDKRQRERESTTAEPPISCSFCGKSQDEVRKIVAGPRVYICDECVDLCNDIIAEECEQEDPEQAKADEPSSGPWWTSLSCPICRLPRTREGVVFVAAGRFLCRPCAIAVQAALADDAPAEDD